MDKKDPVKTNKISMSKIKKVYLPIILTIILVFNIPIFPSSISFNTNLNFQPASGSGESYFFVDSHFNNNQNKKSNSNRDINITIWVVFLILCMIFGFVYFIFNGINTDNEQDKQNAHDKTDYIELLKDDSDYEGNI